MFVDRVDMLCLLNPFYAPLLSLVRIVGVSLTVVGAMFY